MQTTDSTRLRNDMVDLQIASRGVRSQRCAQIIQAGGGPATGGQRRRCGSCSQLGHPPLSLLQPPLRGLCA